MGDPAAQERSIDDLTLGKGFSLEDLVDRSALADMVDSFYELFRVPLRVYSEEGELLAEAANPPEIYNYVSGLKEGRAAVTEVVTTVSRINPSDKDEVSYGCFTGAVYRIVSIKYDQRPIGRMILGPFLPPTVKEIPKTLLSVDPEIDPSRAKELLAQMPRAHEETVTQIVRHLRSSLDLILFSGHKALLTSSMHLASVRESFRDLQEKNNKLQEAYNRLKELDRLKSNFLATVSHELRTPLTSIIGYSEMLKEGIAGDMTDEQREFVQTIHDKGEQLLTLIKGLLDLSKLESGTMNMRKIDTHVGQLIEDVAQTLQPTARKKGVNIAHRFDHALPHLWADPDRLRQVLLNLAENAIKFTPEGGTVTLSAESGSMEWESDGEDGVVLFAQNRPTVDLKVADTGIGISDTEKQRVFDAFYQVDSSSTREQGGTGLGLSIVQRIVDAHDGKVRIEDNEPAGTVFVVAIPLKRATLA